MPGAGLGGTSLPPINVAVNLDDSQLKQAGTTAGGVGKQIESGLGVGKKASSALESGLAGLAAQFGITLPPQVQKSASALLGIASNSTTVQAELTALSTGVKGLANDLGVSVPPQAEKGAVALKGLAAGGAEANAVVGLTSGALVIVEEDLAKAGSTASTTGEKIASGLETGNKAAETLQKGLGGVGKGGEEAAAGLSLATGAAILGVGALTALVVGAKTGVDAYISLADKVEAYQRVAGGTAEEDSRLVEVSQELGVSTDVLAQSMFRFSKVIETTPQKLSAVGIEVGLNASGQVDLTKTLENTADAYVNAGTALEKDAILQAAFGKGGRDMIPILEQGSAGLKELEQAVGLTFSQADIDRARDYKIHTDELGQSWSNFWANIGEHVVPALDDLTQNMNMNDYVNQKLDEARANGTLQANSSRIAVEQLAQKYREEFKAASDASDAAKKHAADLQQEADNAAALVKQEEDLVKQLSDEWTTTQKLDDANITVKESQDKITEATVRVNDANRQVASSQDAYNQAVRDYGKNSPQAKAALDALTLSQIAARKAADDVTKAQDDQYTAYLDAAAAARDQQAAMDIATTGAKVAKTETEKYIDTLQAEANSLDVNSPLRKKLQEYIDQLKSQVPAEISTKYLIQYEATFGLPRSVGTGPGGHGTQHFASGGRPQVGVAATTGEHGIELFTPDNPALPPIMLGVGGPQLFVPPVPGTITPTGASPSGSNGTRVPDVSPAQLSAGGLDLGRIEGLLAELIEVVRAEPSGRTGLESGLHNLIQAAGVSRLRVGAGG